MECKQKLLICYKEGIPKSVFVRHYYLLTKDYNQDVISPLLYKLQEVVTK